MKFYDAKLEKYFALSGTLVKDEPGYRRISQEDREHMKSYNPNASYLATNSSGINIRFKTNSKQIKVKVKLDQDEFDVCLSLLGEHQIKNMLVALKAFKLICINENLYFDIEEVKASLLKVRWKGRLEVMGTKPLVVIDGAHNIQGIKSLSENIKKYFKYNNIYLLLGILADKEVEEMVKIIAPVAKKVYALTPHSDRAELSEKLKLVISKYNPNCVAIEDYKEALNQVKKEASAEDLILISGSLYMIGDIRTLLNRVGKNCVLGKNFLGKN